MHLQRARHTHLRRTTATNGNVEALHDGPRRVLAPCVRARYISPRPAGLRRELDTYLSVYDHDRIHPGRLSRGRIPADIVDSARKMEAR